MTVPHNSLRIETEPGIHIDSNIEAVLRQLFEDGSRHDLLFIKHEFSAGFASRVFLVNIGKTGGRSELPQVVKIARPILIQQEKQAYEDFVRARQVDPVQIGRVCELENGLAGLCYNLVGVGHAKVETMLDYCHKIANHTIDLVSLRAVLDELFKKGDMWWPNGRTEEMFQMRDDYDQCLPVNLFIKPLDAADCHDPIKLSPCQSISHSITLGRHVCLSDFEVVETDTRKREVTLNWANRRINGRVFDCRVRFVGVSNVQDYTDGQVVQNLCGQVVQTRHGQLCEFASRALGTDHTPNSLRGVERLSLSNLSLPNPLLVYQTILGAPRPVNLSIVHGDLNLENILIVNKNQVKLIDFSNTRMGHVLHDLLRLETDIITRLMPKIVVDNILPAGETIYCLYKELHSTMLWPGQYEPRLPHHELEKLFQMLVMVRYTALGYLYDSRMSFDEFLNSGRTTTWKGYYDEYYPALIIYLLGALKFSSLDHASEAPVPKQLAFWGAASIEYLRTSSSVDSSHGNPVTITRRIKGRKPNVTQPMNVIDHTMDLKEYEQQLLGEAPHWVYHILAKVDASSLIGRGLVQSFRESQTFDATLANYKSDNENINRILTTIGRSYSVDGSVLEALQKLKQVGELLEQKFNQKESIAFKKFLLDVGWTVAKASGEGPFGTGEKVSPKEREALGLIEIILNASN